MHPSYNRCIASVRLTPHDVTSSRGSSGEDVILRLPFHRTIERTHLVSEQENQ